MSSPSPAKLTTRLAKLAQEIMPAEPAAPAAAEVQVPQATQDLKEAKQRLERVPGTEATRASIEAHIAELEKQAQPVQSAEEGPTPVAAKRLWEDATVNLKKASAAMDSHKAEVVAIKAKLADLEARTTPLTAEPSRAEMLHQEALKRLVKANGGAATAAATVEPPDETMQDANDVMADLKKLEELKQALTAAGNAQLPDSVKQKYQDYVTASGTEGKQPVTIEQWYVLQCSQLLEQALTPKDEAKRRKTAVGAGQPTPPLRQTA